MPRSLRVQFQKLRKKFSTNKISTIYRLMDLFSLVRISMAHAQLSTGSCLKFVALLNLHASGSWGCARVSTTMYLIKHIVVLHVGNILHSLFYTSRAWGYAWVSMTMCLIKHKVVLQVTTYNLKFLWVPCPHLPQKKEWICIYLKFYL